MSRARCYQFQDHWFKSQEIYVKGGGGVEVPVKLVLIQIFDRTPPKTHNNNIQIHKLQTLHSLKKKKIQ